MANKIEFTFGESVLFNSQDESVKDKADKLIKVGTDLTQYHLFHGKKTVKEENIKFRIREQLGGYEECNREMVDEMLKMAFEQSGMGHVFDENFRNDDGARARMQNAISNNPSIFSLIFDIQTQVIQNVNAREYLQDVFQFADIKTVGYGDSFTWEHGSRALYPISKIGRNVNTANAYNELVKPQTLRPVNYGGKVRVNRYQMLADNYDFGAQMAKLARSFRAQQYSDALTALYSSTYVNAGFTLDVLTKTGYMSLAEKVEGVTGGNARAYGTKLAFGVMSDSTVNNITNLLTSEEYLKNGYIGDLWSVPSFELGSTVDTSTSDFDFRVPNDQIIIASNEAAVLMVLENGFSAKMADDVNGDSVYEYTQAWNVEASAGTIKGIVEL